MCAGYPFVFFNDLGKALAREQAEKLAREAKLAEDMRLLSLAQQEQLVRFAVFVCFFVCFLLLLLLLLSDTQHRSVE